AAAGRAADRRRRPRRAVARGVRDGAGLRRGAAELGGRAGGRSAADGDGVRARDRRWPPRPRGRADRAAGHGAPQHAMRQRTDPGRLMTHDATSSRRPVVWTMSATDPGGGAGIHADTRALDAFGVHGACAVAAVTAQHSLAVTHIEPVSAAVLDAQLAALSEDMPPDAIKTGLLGSLENLRVVVDHVRRLRSRSPDRPVPLVVDPVFGATTGAAFADDALRAAYRDELLPLATLATPNVAEARALVPSSQLLGPEPLARAWRAFGVRAVVVTGGDSDSLAEDELEQLSTARLASRLAEIDARAAW